MGSKRVKKGLWKPEEDMILKKYVETHGEGNWATVSEKSGLMRGGKSCRLRWKNYLRPDIKRGGMSKEEEDLIIRMHKLLGNRWSLIAGRLPGRTDNEVKNYWNTHLNKRNPLGKRKNLETNNQKYICRDGDTNNKRIKTSVDNLNNTTEAGISRETIEDKVDCKIQNLWMEETTNFNSNGMENLLEPANNSTFVFDDEMFMPYMDSFVWFEPIGYGGGWNYTWEGMQSLMPPCDSHNVHGTSATPLD